MVGCVWCWALIALPRLRLPLPPSDVSVPAWCELLRFALEVFSNSQA